jgi:Ser/Thr protein kinase RdoA (MazF antagonist)
VAPKVVVAGPWGKFLVKRRAPGEDHPLQVAFCHALQLHLLERGFPAPALVGTRGDNNSMLQMDGRVYEVSEFVAGEAFDRSAASAKVAGEVLAKFHAGARGFHYALHTPADFAHGDERAEILLDRCVDRVGVGPPPGLGVRSKRIVPGPLLDEIRTLWRRAVADLDHAGIAAWPRDLLHADWHPGNLVFAGPVVRAVLDYDSCRRGPRLADLAAGTLNFSILGAEATAGEADPAPPAPLGPGAEGASPVDLSRWPAQPDESRARAFLAGYQSLQPRLSDAERLALAPAMAGAMILESLGPIATTGAFAGIPGLEFLDMVRRKSSWLLEHKDRVAGLAR